eukprot:gene14027-17056_t
MYSIELKPVKSYCLREPSETYGRRGDDELWKGILEVVFKDFLRFFFEEADQLFDLEQDVVFLDKEFSSIFPAEENAPGVRFVDKLVKVRLKDGSGERFILVHVEVQGQKSHEELSERMFRYYYRIKDKYNISTTAFAILTDREKGYHPRVYVEEFLGTRLSYQFNTYKLLEQDETSLRANPNPFAMVALLRLLKLDLIRALNKRNISIEKHSQIMEFLQYYITFKNPRTMLKFEEEVAELTGRTKPIGVGEILLDRAEKRGLKKGEEKGLEKGMEKGIEKVDQQNHQNASESGQISVPAAVIRSFFSDYHLGESQDLLWQLFKLAFSENWSSLSAVEKENLCTFYEQLDALLAAVYENIDENQSVKEK